MFILGIALWVFLALVGVGIAIIYAVEHEHSFGAFMGLLVSGLLLHFTGTVNMLEVLHNWQSLLMFIGGYVVAGVLWAILKWRSYVLDWTDVQMDNLEKCKQQFITSMKSNNQVQFDSNEIPEKYAELFTIWSSGATPYNLHRLVSDLGVSLPTVSHAVTFKELEILNNMPRILVWCLYWPFSMLWTLIDNPLRKLVEFLVLRVLGGIFKAISQSGVNAVEKQRQAMIKKD